MVLFFGAQAEQGQGCPRPAYITFTTSLRGLSTGKRTRRSLATPHLLAEGRLNRDIATRL